MDNALFSIQVHGGHGCLRDSPAERALRDSTLTSIGGGTTEIQKLIINRLLLACEGVYLIRQSLPSWRSCAP